MTTRYLPAGAFEKWARSDNQTNRDLVEAAIRAAEQELDGMTGRYIAPADASATARVFVPTHRSDLLVITDAAAVTSVVENGTTLTEGTHYQLEPLNGRTVSGQYRPYDVLRRLGGCWYSDGHRAAVSVTANWGWTTIPAEAVEACKVLTADWLEYRSVRLGVVGSTDQGFSIGVRSNPAVRQAINVLSGANAVMVA